MQYKGLIFDLDGTLADSLGFWKIAWDEFGNRYNNGEPFRPNEEDDKTIRTMLMTDAMELIHRHYGFGESGRELADLATALLRDFYENKVQLKPGMREFLKYHYDKGVPMCIASASALDLVQIAAKNCGIEQYFVRILSCSELGMGKDKPDVYLYAASVLGTAVNETCVVEDSLTALRTAKEAGMMTIGIYDQYTPLQDKIAATSDEYIAEGETIEKLIR